MIQQNLFNTILTTHWRSRPIGNSTTTFSITTTTNWRRRTADTTSTIIASTNWRGGADGGTGGGSGTLIPGTPFNFTAANDFRDNTNTDENMAANNPEVVLIVGDFSYNGNAKQWWSKNMNALNSLNVIGALRNHDEPNDVFLNYGHSMEVKGNVFTS